MQREEEKKNVWIMNEWSIKDNEREYSTTIKHKQHEENQNFEATQPSRAEKHQNNEMWRTMKQTREAKQQGEEEEAVKENCSIYAGLGLSI